MSKKNHRVEKRVEEYIEKLFAHVEESQQLFDLKEELSTNMKEKIADYLSQGMDEEEALKETIASMGDLSGLVEDMRQLGQDRANQAVYSTMIARISMAGIIAGVLLILFGTFTASMLYSIDLPAVEVTGNGIFIVAGGALLTYSLLTRETDKKYAMNKIRAALFALAVGLLMFSLFTGTITRFATGETHAAIASTMVFFLTGAGLFLYLTLTGTRRRKA